MRKFGNFSLYSLQFCPNFSSQAPKFGHFQFTSPLFQRQVSVRKPHTSEIRATQPYRKKKFSPPPPRKQYDIYIKGYFGNETHLTLLLLALYVYETLFRFFLILLSIIFISFLVFSITFLLGLTWTLAIFAVGNADLTFSYLFAIVNSLQGFSLFFFQCVLNEDIRKRWYRVCCPKCAPPEDDGNSSHTFYTLNYKDSKTNSKDLDWLLGFKFLSKR